MDGWNNDNNKFEWINGRLNRTNPVDIFLYLSQIDEQLLPVVNAGKDITITLPERTAILNGSKSHDGFGIVSYKWTRSEDSPASGKSIPLTFDL